MNVQERLRRIEDELHAQKAYFAPSLGELKYPETTPTASYTGSINTSSQDLVIARVKFIFTRSDGASTTPFVDFAFDAHVAPNHQQVIQSQGGTISGNDLTSYEDVYIGGFVSSTTDNSVTFTVEVKNAVAPWGSSPKTLTINVAAYSTVKGTLSVEREL